MWDRAREYSTRSVEAQMEYKQQFVRQLKSMPIAIVPEKANEQHYEVCHMISFDMSIPSISIWFDE
jgi:hypothetical protein